MPQETIGARLRALRRWRGMTLDQLAGQAGLSKSFLSMAERGQRSLDRRSHIAALADALHVSETDLVGGPHLGPDHGQSDPHAVIPPDQARPADQRAEGPRRRARPPPAGTGRRDGARRALPPGLRLRARRNPAARPAGRVAPAHRRSRRRSGPPHRAGAPRRRLRRGHLHRQGPRLPRPGPPGGRSRRTGGDRPGRPRPARPVRLPAHPHHAARGLLGPDPARHRTLRGPPGTALRRPARRSVAVAAGATAAGRGGG